ncbi:MAG TPA: BON domain-containing protein [Terriglobales bacterium]|nr:BON domain-containing protein [Terriglobales bacterium]
MTALAQAQAQHQLSPRAEERIQREVFHELNMLPHYSIFDILSYQVQGSTVILSGKVRDPGLQKSAEDAVRHIEGVEKVVNKIQVLPGFPDDERIRVHIARSFWDTGLMRYMMGGAPPIRIIVAAGKVTLEGIVGNEGDKAIARAKAAGVPGVISVENNLRVEK